MESAKTPGKPCISVIVPVYNAEKTIGRCLDSILKQSFPDFELIVINDGSSDSTREICAAYAEKDRRIRIVDQENFGVSAARNAGLEHSVGDWIAFCDSDDTVCDYWLSSLHSATGDADIAVCGYNCFQADSPEIYPVQKTLGHRELFRETDVLVETLVGKELFQNVWNKLFRRSLIVSSNITFKEAFNIFEDEYFVLDCLAVTDSVVCIPECAYNYYSPADYLKKYDCGIDAFQEVVGKLYEALAHIHGRIRLPSLVKWYTMALRRFAMKNSFENTRERIRFARNLSVNFHDGPFDSLYLRILPDFLLYLVLRSGNV